MNLILTFDYELFGDGTGNVFSHIIEPTEKILNHCAEFDIKATIFFEVIDYLKLKMEWERGNSMGYNTNPLLAIENQIQKAALEGHDIQLHIHPQWVNARYFENKWDLDFANWRLGDFFSNSKYSIKDLIQESKIYLEELISEVIPDYKCIALRAGGYNVMPSETVFSAMKEVELKIDSSVYPGGYENSSLSKFDYRHVSVKLEYWWGDEGDITLPSKSKKEILELPVFALPVIRWRKYFNLAKLKSIILPKGNSVSALSKEKIQNKNIWDKIKYAFQKEATPWDVCMFSRACQTQKTKLFIQNPQ
jgi:hypothetical protein